MHGGRFCFLIVFGLPVWFRGVLDDLFLSSVKAGVSFSFVLCGEGFAAIFDGSIVACCSRIIQAQDNTHFAPRDILLLYKMKSDINMISKLFGLDERAHTLIGEHFK